MPTEEKAVIDAIQNSPRVLTNGSNNDFNIIAGSPDRRIAGSPDRRIAGSPDRRIAGSPDRRIAGSPDRRIAGSPDRRIAGSPDRRIAGSPGRPCCVRVTAMSVPAWLHRYWRPSSPPESSRTAGAGGSSRRPASSSDSLTSSTARRLRRGLSSALLCVPLLALLATGAAAQTMVPDNWPLKPSGLSGGDQFRLMFVTLTERDARSSNIADYNSFVQTRAAAGHTSIQSYSAQFRAVGSTATVDARDNTSTTGTGVPIYWLNGAKVADDYADFYDGSWDSTAGRHESGVTTATGVNRVWTGSTSQGTKFSGFTLGDASTFVKYGNFTFTTAGLDNGLEATATSYPLYGLSPVFQVEQSNQLSITAPPDANEGNSGTRNLTFTVTLGTAISNTLHFTVCFAGTATIDLQGLINIPANADYQPLLAGNAQTSNCLHSVIHAGATSQTNVGIRVRGNTVFEPDETVTATLSFRGTPPAGVTLGTSTATHTIRNDDPEPVRPAHGTVRIESGSDITEGAGAVFTVTADPAPSAALKVRLAVTDATESPISNFLRYRDEGFTTVTIAANATTATLTVPTVDDGKYEPDGTVSARILVPGYGWQVGTLPYRLRGPTQARVNVADNDTATAHAPPAVIVSTERDSASSSANVEAGDLVSFCFAVGGPFDGTRSVPTTMPRHFNVNYELRSSSGRLVLDTGLVYENGIMTGARGIPTGTVSTLVKVDNTDLRPNAPTRTKETAATLKACTNFIRTNDMVGETITARVLPSYTKDYRTGAGIPTYAVRSASTATISVIIPMRSPPVVPPDGQPSTVTISADRTSVTEGGDVTFTVTADPAPAHDLIVYLSAEEVMGAGDDSVIHGYFWPVRIRAGEASATWTLTTMSDDDALADGTVTGRIVSGDGYTVDTPSSVSVTLLDDDGVVTQSVPDSVVGDPVTPGVNAALVAEVTAKADGHSNPDAAARLRRIVKGMTGEDGGYTAQECRDIATRHGVLSTWKPWCDEIARREAHTPPVPQQQQVITLPAVSVSAGAGVTEGGDAVFTVTASPAPAAELSVTVTVATAGEFGITAGSRSVKIPTTGSATLTLATSDDEVDEADGSVTATVAAGNGYTVGDPASGSVSIADDDLPLPAIAVSAGDAVTEGGDAVFTVTASPAPASPLAVTVTVAAEGDYGITAGTRTVSIPTTGSATLTLATSDDDADEPDGSVSVTVAAGDGYTVGSPASGSVSVADDDLPPPAVSITAKSASVTEGGAAAFTLTADRAPDADLTVTLSVAETGGGDHVAAADEGPATAVIAKGETEAVFSVATVDDDANEPDGSVTVTLKDGGGYTVPSPPGNAAAVTVSDNDAAALPLLSVADVTIKEGAWMEFTVRLSAPSAGGVSVKVSTRDSTPVSATTRDYWPLSGRTVSFRAGETEQSVGVIVFDDSHDEDAETFEVVLSDARGAAIADGVAVGTIVNDDPMPAAWLARFGRTVAEQALDGIAGRMSADRTPGMQGAIAGQALSFDPAASDNPGSRGAGPGHAPDGAAVPSHAASGSPADGTGALALADVAQAFGGQPGHSGPGGFGHDAAGFANGTQSRTMTARDALLGSSFSLTGAADGSGGSMAFWGRAAQGSFDGREGTFSLDGTVTTGMLGADYARGKWLVGLALAQSEGEGDYRDTDVSPRPDGQSCPDDAEDGHPCNGAVRAGDGSVEASLTAAIPYAALQVSERLKLWGAAGYGTGEVTLKTALGGSYKSDTSWSMAAAGLRGELLAPPAEGSGPALAVTSDALWTRSSSEKTRDLAASDSDATRLRLGLEGSYRMALEGGGHLTPKLEVGARHDGGDAETGFGVELGGGIAWVDPGLGLSLDVSGRTLIAHGNDDLKDRGYAASLAFDPDPATQRGPSLSLRQEFGGQAQGGLDALFQPATLEDRTGSEATSRWSMEAAYGFPAFGGRWTGSPHAGLGFATGARDYSVGWRLTPAANANAPDVSFGLKATRRESDSAAPEHAIGFEITVRW